MEETKELISAEIKALEAINNVFGDAIKAKSKEVSNAKNSMIETDEALKKIDMYLEKIDVSSNKIVWRTGKDRLLDMFETGDLGDTNTLIGAVMGLLDDDDDEEEDEEDPAGFKARNAIVHRLFSAEARAFEKALSNARGAFDKAGGADLGPAIKELGVVMRDVMTKIAEIYKNMEDVLRVNDISRASMMDAREVNEGLIDKAIGDLITKRTKLREEWHDSSIDLSNATVILKILRENHKAEIAKYGAGAKVKKDEKDALNGKVVAAHTHAVAGKTTSLTKLRKEIADLESMIKDAENNQDTITPLQ